MTTPSQKDNTPDLTKGVTLDDFGTSRILRGFVGKKQVLLVRLGDEVVAIGNQCTHYGGRLDRGAIEGETVRCPLHHALFSLRTGEAVGAPAFDPVAVWQVERQGNRYVVREEIQPQPQPAQATTADLPQCIVIVGGGAAGFAAAEMLRRRGYAGSLAIFSADSSVPIDRPNLSKDYLAGSAEEAWMPLRPESWYREAKIDLHLATPVTRIDTARREVVTEGGTRHAYDRLLIATGAEPVHLPIPGADLPHVFTLRAIADARAIITRAESAKTAVVLGSGFIGLETAAALTKRGLKVHVVSLDARPLERILGAALGDAIQARHQVAGTVFHMGNSIAAIAGGKVALKDGTDLPADLVILGVGVRPRLALAEAAGLVLDHGVVVNDRLQTSAPGVYAAGDIARWPWKGVDVRIEHWVVATRQGQVAAENMLGADKPYADVPFFWSAHHDLRLQYVGHAEAWDDVTIDGDIAGRDAMVSYVKGGRTLAVATIGRPQAALAQARAMKGPG
ncbi:FAD-dependent oxidoreductase [Phaeovulum sp.]|uniref:FAD-dependent oxidoreductase n=1 Tax=Phaeovulum sp. TaxID=2934796 RepID=UPI0039E38122